MAAKAATIDQYLATVDDEKRQALEKVRKAIKAAAPDAEECISYGLPAFKLHGKAIGGFGASANHCAYYPMSGAIVAEQAGLLKAYETSKGTIRFQADKPLPAELVRKLLQARLAENEQRRKESP